MDPTYEITFFKRLADSNGHCVDVEQGRVQVTSVDACPAAVIEEANRRFAQARGVQDWRHRADYARLAVLDRPRRGRARMHARKN